MKTLHKLLIALAIMMLSATLFGQTNVSGILYNNTTWTQANSPYIVTDSVIVFPGVTLTIEPGVEVSFEDSTYLHVKDATLIALGNANDSITFTSNSSTPFPGIWGGISFRDSSEIQLQYCNFLYAANALNDRYQDYNFTISNNTFRYNNVAIGYAITGGIKVLPDNCSFIENTIAIYKTEEVTNCQFINNEVAIYFINGSNSKIINSYFCGNNEGIKTSIGSLINCVFTENHIAVNGLNFAKNNIFTLNDTAMRGGFSQNDSAINNAFFNNHIGIIITGANNPTLMSNNTVCNNTVYNIVYNGTSPGELYNICFCETDSAIIASKIYDAYDDITRGILDFTPYVNCDSTALPPFVPTACSPTTCNIYVTANVTAATCGGCSDGQATANVVGISTAPYTYTWYSSPIQNTQTATGLAPGTYDVCVIDANGCTACASIFIDSTNCNGLNVSAQPTNASCSLCSDGAAMASPSGGTPPFAYTWYTSPLQTTQNASGLPPGSYAVCITDANGCTACDSVTISVGSCSAYFNLYADSVPQTYYAVNLASGVAPLSYVWSWGDGSYDSVPYPNHTYSAAGYYDICLSITDSAGCTNTFCSSYFLQKQASAMIYVNVVDPLLTSIVASAKDVSFILFPNPASNTLNITTLQSKDDIQYQIINTLGATITESKTTAKDFSIDVSSLSTGVYFIHLQSGNAQTVKRFVKE